MTELSRKIRSRLGGRLQSMEGKRGGLFIGGSMSLTDWEVLVAYFGYEGASRIKEAREDRRTAELIRSLWRQQAKCSAEKKPSAVAMRDLEREMEGTDEQIIEQAISELMNIEPPEEMYEAIREYNPPEEDITANDLADVFNEILEEPPVDELEEIAERRRMVAEDDEDPELEQLDMVREGIDDMMNEDDLEDAIEAQISEVIEDVMDMLEKTDIPKVEKIVENADSVEEIVEELYEMGALPQELVAGIMSGGLFIGGSVEDASRIMRSRSNPRRKIIRRKGGIASGGAVESKPKKKRVRTEAQKAVQKRNAERLKEVQRIRKDQNVSLKEAWKIFKSTA